MEKELNKMTEEQLKKEISNAIPLEDFIKELEEKVKRDEKFRKKHKVLAFFKDIWWWLRYGIRNKLRDFKYTTRWFIQRGKRGFSDNDFFNGDWFLADLIARFLRFVAENGHTYPGYMISEEWDRRLLEVAQACEEYRDFDSADYVMKSLKSLGLEKGSEEYKKEFNRLFEEAQAKEKDILERMKKLFDFDLFPHLWD